MNTDKAVAEHYGRKRLGTAILEQARQGADDPDNLTIDDFAPFDDMHIGGRKGTSYLMEKLAFPKGTQVLDVGCGIGGPARYVAQTYGVNVTGIDLTPSYKETGTVLSEAVGLEKLTHFETGSALDMPFEDTRFDVAYMIHVGMNVQDKQTLYREVFRVIKPGALFAIYDVMAGQDVESLEFPVPWADSQQTSFLVSPKEVQAMLQESGFDIQDVENRKDFGVAALRKLCDMHLAAGDDKNEQPRWSLKFPAKAANLLRNIENGLCAPWIVIGRKPD